MFGKLALSALVAGVWLTACALVDLRTGHVPNKLTLPVIAGGTVLTLVRAVHEHSFGQPLIMLGLWVIFTVPWSLDIYGGGDQKLLMALSSLCPSMETAVWVSIGMIGSWLVFVSYRHLCVRTKRIGRWRATWTLVPGGIIAIVQRLRLLH